MPAKNHNGICDLLFLAGAALFSWLAYEGVVTMSAGGAIMDSDLQTYAQALARAKNPALFSADPILATGAPGGSIPNLLSLIAGWLTPAASTGELANYAIGLLRAGAITLFTFYALWYAFGRWLFRAPVAAAALSVLSGITIWVGWGTFWGILHSDPVPRSLFAAVFPLLLMLAITAIKRPGLRPVAMFCAGLCMWIHSVSALNCGGMLFVAFFFFKPARKSWGAHLGNCFFCLCAFFGPVAFYLWPTFARVPAPQDLEIYQDAKAIRWMEDYSNFGRNLLSFLSPKNQPLPILIAGLVAWFTTAKMPLPRFEILRRLIPAFFLGLFVITAFCWAESHYSAQLKRLPIGHELVRGLRFLIPLAWILVVAAVSRFTGTWSRRLILVCLIGGVALTGADRQLAGAQYQLARLSGLPLPLAEKAAQEQKKAENLRTFMAEAMKKIPEGDLVFTDGDNMAIRYMALRPVAYTFKDGAITYYNKDADGLKKWLEYEEALQAPDALGSVWRKSGAPWLIFEVKHGRDIPGETVLEINGWRLMRQNGSSL